MEAGNTRENKRNSRPLVITEQHLKLWRIAMKKQIWLAAGIAGMLIGSPTAKAEVNVHVGVGGNRPPSFVLDTNPNFINVPNLGFYVSVGGPQDIIRYDGSYYVNHYGRWYMSYNYRGPWILVREGRLPRQIRHHRWEEIRNYRDVEYRRYERRNYRDGEYRRYEGRDNQDNNFRERDPRDRNNNQDQRNNNQNNQGPHNNNQDNQGPHNNNQNNPDDRRPNDSGRRN
jgi:hypothetical protein